MLVSSIGYFRQNKGSVKIDQNSKIQTSNIVTKGLNDMPEVKTGVADVVTNIKNLCSQDTKTKKQALNIIG